MSIVSYGIVYSNIMRVYGVMITMKRRFKTVALDIARGIDADELHIIHTHIYYRYMADSIDDYNNWIQFTLCSKD